MIKSLYPAWLLTLLVFLLAAPVRAQDDEPAPPTATDAGEEAVAEEPELPASQEVEINEDNYRQFMELKDANRQRNIIPENIFKPDSGLQKLEKLPEDSQKHLRNQLREIIVQGDEWKPGDEETEYPYTPSEAAGTDPSLEQQEKEAWGELVDSYHQRESQIYENSSGSQSAMGSEQGSSNAGNGPGSTGETGQSGEGSEGQQAGQEGNPDQSDTEGTYSPNGSTDSSGDSTAGVSQNAMEFLQGLGQGGSGTGEGSSDSPGDGGQGESPTPSEAQAQTGQQDSSEPDNALTGNSPTPPRDPNARSTAGASQNAMEFLKGISGQGENSGSSGTDSSAANGDQGQAQGEQSGGEHSDSPQSGQSEGQQDAQAGDQENGQEDGQEGGEGDDQANGQDAGQGDGEEDGQSQDGQQSETAEESKDSTSPASSAPISSSESEEESTAGASQNALEYLTGDSIQGGDGINPEQDTNQAKGTLSLQDLLNAQGVGDTSGTDPTATNPDEEQQVDETKPKKDGDG